MKYYSLHHKSPKTSFKNAVVNGIAPDRGLYFPEKITPLTKDFIDNISDYSNHEIAFTAIQQFVSDEIPDEKLKEIMNRNTFPAVRIFVNFFMKSIISILLGNSTIYKRIFIH